VRAAIPASQKSAVARSRDFERGVVKTKSDFQPPATRRGLGCSTISIQAHRSLWVFALIKAASAAARSAESLGRRRRNLKLHIKEVDGTKTLNESSGHRQGRREGIELARQFSVLMSSRDNSIYPKLSKSIQHSGLELLRFGEDRE
jgi:hypothetical protein